MGKGFGLLLFFCPWFILLGWLEALLVRNSLDFDFGWPGLSSFALFVWLVGTSVELPVWCVKPLQNYRIHSQLGIVFHSQKGLEKRYSRSEFAPRSLG